MSYPSRSQLKRIKDWPHNDHLGMVEYITSIWYLADWGITVKWGNDEDHGYLVLKMYISTAGWSGNEEILQVLKKTRFWIFHWVESRRGGHSVLYIRPESDGYKLVSKYCKDNNVSRQSVYQQKEKFDWIVINHNKRLIRPKNADKI